MSDRRGRMEKREGEKGGKGAKFSGDVEERSI